MEETVTRLILQKLDKIDTKQDEIEKKADDMVPAMVRMEERQVQIHASLNKGAQVMEDHGNRLTSLEKTRDRGYTIIATVGAMWTAVIGFLTWILTNLHVLPKIR